MMKPGTITVTFLQASGIREAMRPLSLSRDVIIEQAVLLLFHERVLLLMVEFETTPGMERGDLVLTRDECLLLSQFLSAQDGDWAADVLKQSRRALYELRTKVLPGYKEDTSKLMEGLSERPSDEHNG